MKVKKLICMVCCFLVLCGLFDVQQVDAEKVSKNGFSFDTSSYKVKWNNIYEFNVFTQKGGKLGTCSCVYGLARRKNTNNYVLLWKAIMTPNDESVKKNTLQKGYGFSEFLSLKTTLPSLEHYYPTNQPKSDEISFNAGFDSSKTLSIGASYTIKKSQLEITSKCNTPKKIYSIEYDYCPSMANPFGSNKYLANESFQMGYAQFSSNKKTICITMDVDARFGAAENDDASPWLVYMNYVRSKKDSRTFSFTVPKK